MGSYPNIYSTGEFYRILERERARTNRNGYKFSLLTFRLTHTEGNGKSARDMQDVLVKRLRSSDVVGWIDQERMASILFNTPADIAQDLAGEIRHAVNCKTPSPEVEVYSYPFVDKKLSCAISPSVNCRKENNTSQTKDETGKRPVQDIRPFLVKRMPVWKRCLDIAGSLLGLLFFSPVFLFAMFLIKLVSPGPVFFRQERVGYGKRPFMMLKFRTMECKADKDAHREYYAKLINKSDDGKSPDKPMTKMDDDLPCIRFAGILRSTALDELPQLINVLRGEMSLVGPRPPIPYEVDQYLMWHHNRFDTVPGMTGLWQVSGKNKLTFKEMIRLDIRYTKEPSFWRDIKIILKTPLVVMMQTGELLVRKYKKSSLMVSIKEERGGNKG
jgi:lipopolysaccharide/colanic/teichoic acid biosynthesis glycosyltransferase